MLSQNAAQRYWRTSVLTCCVLILFVAQLDAAVKVEIADSVSVKSKRTVLVRSGDISPERRRATVVLPIIGGGTTAARKIRLALRLENIFGTPLTEYKETAWLTRLDFKVNYNKNFIFDITFTQQGIGAYPDTHTAHFIFNLRSGEIIRAKDVFEPASLSALAEMTNDKLQDEVRQLIRYWRERDDLTAEQKNNLPETFSEVKFAIENLDDFSVSDQGVTFLYDAGFPHAIKALQPEERYFLSYTELVPHISRRGLLARFVR